MTSKLTITREQVRERLEYIESLNAKGVGTALHQQQFELACLRELLSCLESEPTDDERIMAIEGIHNCERCGHEGWVVGEMGITRCACSQAGNSPVIPAGYVLVPREPTEEMIVQGFESAPDEHFSAPEVWEAYQKMSGCQQAAHCAKLCWEAMIAAAPQEGTSASPIKK